MITAFAPATIANVGPCFDRAGFAVGAPGDIITATWNDSGKVEITSIKGDHGKLPLEPQRNTAGVVAIELLRLTGESRGISLTVTKQMPLYSGLGSSAASSAAAAVAVNRLLDDKLTKPELLPACALGEEVACGAAHLDNVAPSLLGSLTIIEGQQATKVELPFDFTVVLVTPDYRLSTARSRAAVAPITSALDTDATAKTAQLQKVQNLADFTAIISANELLEKARGALVPGFSAAQAAGLAAGALAVTLSGSGPSVFAITTPETAERVKVAVQTAFRDSAQLKSQAWITQLDSVGARII